MKVVDMFISAEVKMILDRMDSHPEEFGTYGRDAPYPISHSKPYWAASDTAIPQRAIFKTEEEMDGPQYKNWDPILREGQFTLIERLALRRKYFSLARERTKMVIVRTLLAEPTKNELQYKLSEKALEKACVEIKNHIVDRAAHIIRPQPTHKYVEKA